MPQAGNNIEISTPVLEKRAHQENEQPLVQPRSRLAATANYLQILIARGRSSQKKSAD